MGCNEAGTPSKSEKASSPAQEQTSVHAYPDWAAIQAYYGPGVGLPPYFSPAVTPGHAPHPYMWGPQPMMPPYGSPYAALYPHGGVYAHPSVPVGSHAHGISGTTSATTSEPVTATTLSIDTHSKSSGNKDQGLIKKLKGFNGLAVSIGNGNSENATNGTEHGLSHSENCGREGSSDGSDGNTKLQGKVQKKSSERTGQSVASKEGKPTGNSHLSGTSPGMDFGGSSTGKSKLSSTPVPLTMVAAMPTRDGVPSEHWMQDERELKRERRKQSNRESARRSRLRKQAETEELTARVESLTQENVALKSEMNLLTEKSEKLRQENSALMEKLKKAQIGQAGARADSDKTETQEAPPVTIENLLSRVNNSSPISRSGQQEQRESEMRENANSNAKLHQLLESNSRTDAVAAS